MRELTSQPNDIQRSSRQPNHNLHIRSSFSFLPLHLLVRAHELDESTAELAALLEEDGGETFGRVG